MKIITITPNITGNSDFIVNVPEINPSPNINVTRPRGLQGSTGLQGIKGDQGETGAQGLKGDKGDTGSQGIQGIQGLKGDKGEPQFFISETQPIFQSGIPAIWYEIDASDNHIETHIFDGVI